MTLRKIDGESTSYECKCACSVVDYNKLKSANETTIPDDISFLSEGFWLAAIAKSADFAIRHEYEFCPIVY